MLNFGVNDLLGLQIIQEYNIVNTYFQQFICHTQNKIIDFLMKSVKSVKLVKRNLSLKIRLSALSFRGVFICANKTHFTVLVLL